MPAQDIRTSSSMVGALTAFLVAVLACLGYYGPDLVDRALLPGPPPPLKSSGRARQWGPHKDTEESVPYNVNVDEATLADLKNRLDLWRSPGAPMDHADSWSYGMDLSYMSDLVQYWKDSYDWKRHEAQLNAVGMREIVVDGLQIRFQEIRRGRRNKAILLLHGWPGSIWEFRRYIDMVQSQKRLEECSIVCPSLPGYGFSSAPTIEGYSTVAMAGTMQRLMKKLGYQNYIIQAGDWGSMVAESMVYLDPSPVIGLHLNFFPIPFSPGHFLPELIKIRVVDGEESQARSAKARDVGEILQHTGYLHQQATKPETLGYSLSDSPVGLCAWITEKFQSWSDPALPLDEKFHKDNILTNCMIYWITNSITSSMRLYKEYFRSDETKAVASLQVKVPVALSLFPFELFPAADTAVKRKFTNIMVYSKHNVGGHFAALEHPDLLLGDTVAFVMRLEEEEDDDEEEEEEKNRID